MLITNYRYNSNVCGHYHSGETRPDWILKPHTMQGYFNPAQTELSIEQLKRDSFPTGSNPPYSYLLGIKGALLSSTTTTNGTSNAAGYLVQGINLGGSSAGISSLSANLSLVVSLAGTSAGVASVVGALVGIVSLAGSVSGSASIAASLKLVSSLAGASAGSASASANLKGIAYLAGDIYVNESTATVQQLVEGVWNALAADFNTSGTMGEAMGAAGTAGDPWTTTLPGGYTGDQAGAIVDRLETLIKQVKALTSAGL